MCKCDLKDEDIMKNRECFIYSVCMTDSPIKELRSVTEFGLKILSNHKRINIPEK